MKSAELIPKRNSVFNTVANPPVATPVVLPTVDPTTGEVLGHRMPHDSQANIDSWYDIFREMAQECPDWKSRR